jgi:hypothetical protein
MTAITLNARYWTIARKRCRVAARKHFRAPRIRGVELGFRARLFAGQSSSREVGWQRNSVAGEALVGAGACHPSRIDGEIPGFERRFTRLMTASEPAEVHPDRRGPVTLGPSMLDPRSMAASAACHPSHLIHTMMANPADLIAFSRRIACHLAPGFRYLEIGGHARGREEGSRAGQWSSPFATSTDPTRMRSRRDRRTMPGPP